VKWDNYDGSTQLDGVFGHFQNLNLLVLLQDVREGRTARQAWLSVGSLLCPVAHGMPGDVQVQTLQALGQTAELHVGCNYAARHMSADPEAVLQFVSSWDADALSNDTLLCVLEEIWRERLADAEAVQELLQAAPSTAGDADRRDDESEATLGPATG
jgi:hypothetical protein